MFNQLGGLGAGVLLCPIRGLVGHTDVHSAGVESGINTRDRNMSAATYFSCDPLRKNQNRSSKSGFSALFFVFRGELDNDNSQCRLLRQISIILFYIFFYISVDKQTPC